MVILNQLHKDHDFSLDLFSRIKKSLRFNFGKNTENINSFVEELPHNLKTELSIYLYEKTYTKVDFLKSKSGSFLAWVCPQLKSFVTTPNEYIYCEADEIEKLFFVKEGNCSFVLPKFMNCGYIKIKEGSMFGTLDIIANFYVAENQEM